MSHGSHALSVAGARGLQQVFGYFGRRSRGVGRARLAHAGPTLAGQPVDSPSSCLLPPSLRDSHGSLSLNNASPRDFTTLLLWPHGSPRVPTTFLSGASPHFSPAPYRTSLSGSSRRFAIVATRLALRLFLVGLSTFVNSFQLAVCLSVGFYAVDYAPQSVLSTNYSSFPQCFLDY